MDNALYYKTDNPSPTHTLKRAFLWLHSSGLTPLFYYSVAKKLSTTWIFSQHFHNNNWSPSAPYKTKLDLTCMLQTWTVVSAMHDAEKKTSRLKMGSIFLCHLLSIAAHRDHFVRRLSVRPYVCLSVCLSVR